MLSLFINIIKISLDYGKKSKFVFFTETKCKKNFLHLGKFKSNKAKNSSPYILSCMRNTCFLSGHRRLWDRRRGSVKNPNVSLSFILAKNEKVEHYTRIKTHKLITLWCQYLM